LHAGLKHAHLLLFDLYLRICHQHCGCGAVRDHQVLCRVRLADNVAVPRLAVTFAASESTRFVDWRHISGLQRPIIDRTQRAFRPIPTQVRGLSRLRLLLGLCADCCFKERVLRRCLAIVAMNLVRATGQVAESRSNHTVGLHFVLMGAPKRHLDLE